MPADDFTWKISNQSEAAHEPRILEARFGGGYRQAAADGINNVQMVLNVQFNNVKRSYLKEIHDFLKLKGGWQRFLWTPPPPFDADGQKSWLCKTWRSPWNGGEAMSLTATFEEVSAS